MRSSTTRTVWFVPVVDANGCHGDGTYGTYVRCDQTEASVDSNGDTAVRRTGSGCMEDDPADMLQHVAAAACQPRCAQVCHFYSPITALSTSCCPQMPGLIGRSATVLAGARPGAACSPTCSGRPSARDSESGSFLLLREPVGRHIVDCRATANAKSGPPRRKSRRIKGSGDFRRPAPATGGTKCFKFDMGAARQRHAAGARPRRPHAASNYFLGTFPNPGIRPRAAIAAERRDAVRREMFQRGNTTAASSVWSYVKTPLPAPEAAARRATRRAAVCVTRFFLQQCIHRTTPCTAIRSGRTTTRNSCA
ncbi:hypothetical protein BLA24064_05668 [Burkholderia latens]|uniref:Uncharacterized protein n=1 Tax=Burkholderia latens TaxID=488446 RepID=A0A6P2Q973_9BURK|nr:hypothetical protein BLA24064_05668 [Burkholderia latens]